MENENKDLINKKLSDFFDEKLNNYFSKFNNDINHMEEMKYEFNSFYYELENLKNEIFLLTSKDKDLSISLTTRNLRNDIHKTEANQPLTSRNNIKKPDFIRSKTPTKLKTSIENTNKSDSNKSFIDNPKKLDSNKTMARSKTPNKLITKPNNKGLNDTSRIKINPLDISLKKDNKIASGIPILNNKDVHNSKIKPKLLNGSSNGGNISNKNQTSASKRDLTPNIKKRLPNLDISTISVDAPNLDNKGNQTQRNKVAKVINFSKGNNDNTKNNLDKTKKVINSGNNLTNETNKDDKKNKSGIMDKENISDSDETINKPNLMKKDESVRNILDIIAEKNKEVNIEEIMNNYGNNYDTPDKKEHEKSPQHVSFNEEKNENHEIKKKIESPNIENINQEIIDDGRIKNIEEIKDFVEQEIQNIENDNIVNIEKKETEVSPFKENPFKKLFNKFSNYLNKKNIILHYIIISK